MKENLTKEEIELMNQTRDEWINRFNSLEFDEKKAKELMKFLYKLLKRKEPVIVILDSPLAIQFACNMNKGSQVRSQVESQVWSQVKSQVRSQVRSQVESQVWSQVKSQVWSQVWSQKLEYYYESLYGRCDDFYWVSFYDLFERLGIIKNKLFNQYKELIKCNLFTSNLQEGVCYVSRPPVFLKRDERNNMHCDSDYAIYFKDGFGLHYVHGVYFSPEDFNKYVKDRKASGKDILMIKNTEQKASLIKLYGYEKIISNLGDVKVLDRLERVSQVTNKNTVCEVMEFNLDSNIICRVLKVEDHSVHKITFLGVPREKQTETCLGALAWTFKLEDGYYKPILES